ncbi:Peptidase B [Serratia rubidaea]|uniref:Peptidase B n=1 Tax=Serratia rubidaea TaxID=61652 RepID=A0A4U9HQW8_SERRU|nr:Peptidase B [Serratia rubidaea]
MTTETMQITLSHQPADARWGEKALLSTNNDGITIHLTGNGKLGAIQRAARKIDGQGIRQVTLAGEGWGLEQSWAFWQGFRGPKGQRSVEWPQLSADDRQELDRRLKIVDWVRDTINMPAEDLGPEQLRPAPLT